MLRIYSKFSTIPKFQPKPPTINKTKIRNVNKVILVASGKGGVGKSTTAINLALGLAKVSDHAKGQNRVGILDADIFGPSIPRLMNLRHVQEPDLTKDGLIIPPQNYGVPCMSMGFLVKEANPIVWRGMMVTSAINKLLRNIDWGELDYLIIDMPPGTGDTQISIAQGVPVDGAIIVSTPQALAISDALKGAVMFKKVNIPVLGLVQNMSIYECLNCGTQAYIFGNNGAFKLCQELEIDLLGDVPLNTEIMQMSDDGTPIVIANPNSNISQIYIKMAQKLHKKLS